MGRTCERFTPGQRNSLSARAMGAARDFWFARPIAIQGITLGTSTANTTVKQEELEWKTKRDPIKNFSQWLMEQKFSDEGKLKGIREEVRAEMKAAVEFAIAAPYPTVDQVDQD